MDFFLITEKVRKAIFGQTQDRFALDSIDFTPNSNSVILNFYEFNFLVCLTLNQDLSYAKLYPFFFIGLKDHKDKIFFKGVLKNNIFILTEVIHLLPPNKISLFIKKRIKKFFTDIGFNVTTPKLIKTKFSTTPINTSFLLS